MLQALPNTLGNSWLAKQAQPLGMTMLCGSGGPDLRRRAVHAVLCTLRIPPSRWELCLCPSGHLSHPAADAHRL